MHYILTHAFPALECHPREVRNLVLHTEPPVSVTVLGTSWGLHKFLLNEYIHGRSLLLLLMYYFSQL